MGECKADQSEGIGEEKCSAEDKGGAKPVIQCERVAEIDNREEKREELAKCHDQRYA